MNINLQTLPPAVQGASYARLIQGVNADGTIPTVANPAPFLITDILEVTIFLGQELATVFSPQAAWVQPSLAQFSFAYDDTQGALLSIDTVYYVEAFASRTGTTFPLMAALNRSRRRPAASPAGPPDLVSIPYAGQLLGQLNLNVAQLESVPTLITAASDAIRSWCNRRFDQGLVTETLPVELDGTILQAQRGRRSTGSKAVSSDRPRTALLVHRQYDGRQGRRAGLRGHRRATWRLRARRSPAWSSTGSRRPY